MTYYLTSQYRNKLLRSNLMSLKIGWIDFTSKDRANVDKVLDNVYEKNVLDELGVGALDKVV